jgi:hypothetical protein
LEDTIEINLSAQEKKRMQNKQGLRDRRMTTKDLTFMSLEFRRERRKKYRQV